MFFKYNCNIGVHMSFNLETLVLWGFPRIFFNTPEVAARFTAHGIIHVVFASLPAEAAVIN